MNKFFEFLRTPLAGAVIFLLQRLLGSMAEAGQRAGRRPENSREGDVTGIAVGGSEAVHMAVQQTRQEEKGAAHENISEPRA
ncbi:hypothetical protein [uncultured Megasphaera sp.]|uniref:hypothetical protein n=1 Tax=uncultured Megasphaera sp. TaxID=165188 RepID=UPI002591D588|nr:hypothetical protein [uncultured Megasphaera sp.]